MSTRSLYEQAQQEALQLVFDQENNGGGDAFVDGHYFDYEEHHHRPTTNDHHHENNDRHGRQRRHRQATPPSSPIPMGRVESVAPGHEFDFRGTFDATWEAIMDGRNTVSACSCCGQYLYCMDSVELVLCPECGVISPVDQSGPLSPTASGPQKSIGLGFTSQSILARNELR